MTLDPGTLSWLLIALCIVGLGVAELTSRAFRETVLYWAAALILGSGLFGVIWQLLVFGTLTVPAGG